MIALLLTVAAGHELAVTPVQQVLAMMTAMKAAGEQAVADEAALFGEYQAWCKTTLRTKTVAITAADDRIAQLKAKVQKADADASQLADDVADRAAENGQLSAEKKQATEVREAERADFSALHQDYSESLDAMAAALRTLKSVHGNIANALVQTQLKKLPHRAQRVLSAFLEESSLKQTGPAGNAYESSVGSVIEMIEDLNEKLTEENAQLERDEEGREHSYQMLQQQLTMSIEAAQNEHDTKAERKAQRAEDSAGSSADLASTTATRDEDTTYRADTRAMCSTAGEDFGQRQQLRKEELEALQQAIDIIGSGSVAGKADKHLPALVQRSFALLRADKGSAGPATRSKVEQFLQAAAKKSGSRVLSLAAAQLHEGPFDKVAEMIRGLIAKLMEEAGEEADHKGWCDSELATNKQTREQKTESVDDLMALSDKLQAQIQRLAQEMADLSGDIAELDAAVEHATEQRRKEKAENTQAIADAKEAQVAVRRATGILKDFYQKAAAATALVQHKAPADDAPGNFNTPYRGMGGSSTGVVGMLETILSDFVRLQTETSSEEAGAVRAFKEFAGDAKADRSAKAQSLEAKTKAKISREKELNQAQEDMARSQTELSAALDYHDELKTSCVDANVSYGERVTRREEEIASLKDALKILSDE